MNIETLRHAELSTKQLNPRDFFDTATKNMYAEYNRNRDGLIAFNQALEVKAKALYELALTDPVGAISKRDELIADILVAATRWLVFMRSTDGWLPILTKQYENHAASYRARHVAQEAKIRDALGDSTKEAGIIEALKQSAEYMNCIEREKDAFRARSGLHKTFAKSQPSHFEITELENAIRAFLSVGGE